MNIGPPFLFSFYLILFGFISLKTLIANARVRAHEKHDNFNYIPQTPESCQFTVLPEPSSAFSLALK